MAFHALSSRNFRVAGDERKTLDIDVGGKILLFIKTQDCEGCRAFFPIFQELARSDHRIGYAILDISSPSERAVVRMSRDTSTSIDTVPYIVMYNNGSPVAKYKGKKTYQAVQSFITEILQIIERQKQTRPFIHDPAKNGAYGPYSSYAGPSETKIHMPVIAGKLPGKAQHGPPNPYMNDVEEEEDDVLMIPDEITPHNTPWKCDYKKLTMD
jgi:thiol-disulfide isomerase/thioredoxin